MYCDILLLFIFSIFGYKLLLKLITQYKSTFIESGFSGKDLNKHDRPIIPEAQGVLAGCVYLIILYTFLPFLFSHLISPDRFAGKMLKIFQQSNDLEVNYILLGKYLAALQCICFMVLLGFADDALDLRWKHKMILPSIASIPLLMAHFILVGNTTVKIPIFVRNFIGESVDISILYYLYMGMLSVFCTNAINIYAGVNGLEAGQSCIISISIIVLNFLELLHHEGHYFSIYFMLPFLIISLALLKENWYPARVFVGDSYCYFAGITFASVGILGHFSKTLLLFFIPQIINFLLSVPQLFKVIPCPRHRLPRLDVKSGDLLPSSFLLKVDGLGRMGQFVLRLASRIGLTPAMDRTSKEVEVINFTLINLFLVTFGSCRENVLTKRLLLFQIICSVIGFIIRYPLARLLYSSPV